MSAYTSLENEFIAQLDEGIVTASNALAKLLRLQQITSGFVGGVVGESDGRKIVQLGNSKRSALREIFEDISPDQPIVVFCRFINDLESIHSVSAEVGRSSLELSGSKKELEDWQAGKANVLAVQIQSGGVGIDLTRSCYAIYYSTGFSLSDYEQSLARLHRPGQKSNVTYIHLVAKKTVDEKVARALSKRASVVESVLKQYSNAELTGGESRPVE
jgi:SNF2 family DNA or RNA helicase